MTDSLVLKVHVTLTLNQDNLIPVTSYSQRIVIILEFAIHLNVSIRVTIILSEIFNKFKDGL